MENFKLKTFEFCLYRAFVELKSFKLSQPKSWYCSQRISCCYLLRSIHKSLLHETKFLFHSFFKATRSTWFGIWASERIGVIQEQDEKIATRTCQNSCEEAEVKNWTQDIRSSIQLIVFHCDFYPYIPFLGLELWTLPFRWSCPRLNCVSRHLSLHYFSLLLEQIRADNIFVAVDLAEKGESWSGTVVRCVDGSRKTVRQRDRYTETNWQSFGEKFRHKNGANLTSSPLLVSPIPSRSFIGRRRDESRGWSKLVFIQADDLNFPVLCLQPPLN